MTKVYVLSSGNQMDDYELHGIFSRYWKAYKARLIFSTIVDKEMYITDYELDELEQAYAEVQSGVHHYLLDSPKYSTIPYAGKRKWYVYKSGIYRYLPSPSNEILDKDYAYESENSYYAHVKATSPEEAIEKAEKLLAENKDATE